MHSSLCVVHLLTATDFSTRYDVDNYLNNIEQEFRAEMSRSFMKEYTKRSADAGKGFLNPVVVLY